MGLNASTIWEVRPGAGADTNGGGFDPGVTSPGTDYSQQDGAQVTYTDLVAVTTTTITSAAFPFTSAHVGNHVRVNSGTGWTVGVYSIRSVSGVTATVDRAIATSSSTGGNGKLGGALATLQSGFSLASSDAISGHSVWVKATGTLTHTTAMVINSHARFYGYSSVRGDGGRVSITCATNSVILIDEQNAGYQKAFSNFNFSHTAGTRGIGYRLPSNNSTGNDFLMFDNCVFDGFSIGIDGGSNSGTWRTLGYTQIINCEIKNSVSHGIIAKTVKGLTLRGCYIHDNGGCGLNVDDGASDGTLAIEECVFKSNGSYGVDWQPPKAGLQVCNSAFLNNGASGIRYNGPNTTFVNVNNVYDSNTTYGVQLITPGTGSVKANECGGKNAFRANGTAARLNTSAPHADDITLTADPFTDRSTGDFSLNATAGGGASLKGAGFALGF